jgi:hypothetical protein
MYGHVDDSNPRGAKDREVDGFEALLALARVLGFTYEVRKYGLKGWTIKLELKASPGDFYKAGLSPRPLEGSTRAWSTVSHLSRYEGLHETLCMALRDTQESAEAWRKVVSGLPEYEGWFIKS